MGKKQILRATETTEVDYATGEVKTQSTTRESFVSQEPDFIKLYLDDVAYLNNVGGCSDLLRQYLKLVTYDGIIVLNAAVKRRIAASLGVTVKHIENQTTKLVKQNVIIRRDRGLYEANPHIFGKGAWKDIQERRKGVEVIVSYTEEGGRQVKYSVPKEEQKEEQQDLPFNEEGLAKAS